ncbi:hypothetical protein M0805_006363 [Coniferiporia weirii]|nr:hypothetical protein M0805_006363 [Coniferiporia weirii]
MATNVDILTQSHTVLKAKARAKRNQIDSVIFDDTARREYLTGFRKRNLLKKQAAKDRAKERERQERLQARREQRQALQDRARQNAQMVESAFRKNDDSDVDEHGGTGFEGFSTSDKGKGKATQEFEDDEQLATVTVIEEFDPDSLRHMSTTYQTSPERLHAHSEGSFAASTPSSKSLSRQDFTQHSGVRREVGQPQQAKAHARANSTNIPAKKMPPKKIAYETKAARKATRQKQRARKTEKAELAGGKPRRKERGGGGKKGKKGQGKRGK